MRINRVCALWRTEAADCKLINGSLALKIANCLKALARAIYSRKKVLILDDVFSGLDSRSEDCIFSALLGKNGLMRSLGTTVILATHAAHRLSYADYIIAFNENGKVSEQGTMEELVKRDGYVANLNARHRKESEELPRDEKLTAKPKKDDDTARENAIADLNRPMGNWADYSYYLGSAGWHIVFVEAALIIVYSVLMRFPGKVAPLSP